ncbi:hypothetical protein L249_2731 [Ophiocordyceps polyrhachis-furcata BCC 54312]|uniref:Small ribosomal subunit protein uS7m n=1 Tax=Ophiocordyceps polyrhachis-furcata BCC 54312 TaxID=1330021 RepID=A0A367LND9_9HYPO|nr:hypothetical protein L249_2731 [Ophiocordyceps polyrhachis-furcata BCC 54312]
MSPGLRIWAAGRAFALHARPAVVLPKIQVFRQVRDARRSYSDHRSNKPATSAAQAGGPGQEPQANNIPPMADAAGQAADDAPRSFIDTLDDATLGMYESKPLTPAQQDVLYTQGRIPNPDEAETILSDQVDAEEAVADTEPELEREPEPKPKPEDPGHKYGLPEKPYPPNFHLKKRYHPVLDQITRLLMRDGKLSVAQRNISMVMNFLRTSPPPIYSPKFPLLPGTPPAWHLPLNPILYITIAIDSVAPLIQISKLAGAAGGGRALEIPRPLAVRQRRRIAFKWILDVIESKHSRGSGRKQFPSRIADEIIAVVEGRSSVWEKRKAIHKLGTASRSNVGTRRRGKPRV